jgi:hypothetical protein
MLLQKGQQLYLQLGLRKLVELEGEEELHEEELEVLKQGRKLLRLL